ncbi:MAG TPA: MarR family winged helix-turn-helix transcriptional regulator [Pyrinomonadaceae bacterium]|nr:MarR family winged helix-turn-helix transcriptional regulator [Pyrinomonadaceae bacterium]
MNFETNINYKFSQITNDFWLKLEKSMNEIGLHGGQIFILISLWSEDGQSQIDLSKKLKSTPPTIHKMIKSLRKNNFINVKRDKKDARIVRVFLTAKGNDIRAQVEDQWIKLESEFFSPLTETEKLILLQISEKLGENLTGKVETQDTPQ